MKLEEAYSTLRLAAGASMEEVKRSYRSLAFELHPDLNQDDPNASARFQLVNEAYVLLKHHVVDGGAQAGAGGGADAAAGAQSSESPWGGDRVWTGQKKRAADKKREQARGRAASEADRSARRASGRKAGRGENKTGGFWATFMGGGRKAPGAGSGAASRQGPSGQAQSGPAQSAKTEYQKSTYRRPGTRSSANPTAGSAGATAPPSSSAQSSGFYYEKEEVLQDILRDPFARQVFEDIFAEIRRDGRMSPGAISSRKRKLSFQWGDRTVTVNLSRGLWGGTKYWLRRQMDDEQVIRLPATSLRPGIKVRLQISRGWSGKSVSFEVTLPVDFKPGRSIRLKGLGRSLGPWQGDLYLRLLPK